MKETVRASLAGIGFVFDKDAFEVMEAYHEKLASAYKSNPDGQEIISDIEARMVEIILTRQNTEQVVSKHTAEEVINQLGTPEAGEDVQLSVPPPPENEVFPRRLYRNLEGAKLGGVCSGLGSYFDVDPSIVRIAMAIPLFLLIIFPAVGFHPLNAFLGSLIGVIVILYVLMWFAVPAAKTPRQKLEMQGRRITATGIEREMAVVNAAYTEGPPRQGAFARLFGILGTVLLFSVKMILLIIGFGFAMAALGIFVGIIGLLFGAPWILGVGGWENAGDFVLGHSAIPATAFAAMLLGVILLPLVMLVYQIIRMTLGNKNNSTLMWILGGAWILLTVFTTITAVTNEGVIRNLRGIRYEFRHWDMPDPAGGWEIYERNVQAFRDSVDRVNAGELPETGGTTIGGDIIEGPAQEDGNLTNE